MSLSHDVSSSISSNNAPDFSSEPHYELIEVITFMTASLGILGSLFIIFTFCIFREARSFGTRLVFYLSFADLFHSLEWFPWGSDTVLCRIQGIVMQWSELSYYSWCVCIAICIYQIHFLGREENDVSSLMPIYQICCWFLPLVVALIPLYEGYYGRGKYNWCWIQDNNAPFTKGFLVIPFFAVLIINSSIYFVVHRKISKYKSEFTRKVSLNMLFYMFAFIVAQAPATINRLQSSLQPDNLIFELYLLQAIFHPLQGFVDALAYGVNEPAFTSNYSLLLMRCGFKRGFGKVDEFSRINSGSFAPSIPTAEYNYDYEDSPSTRRKLIIA